MRAICHVIVAFGLSSTLQFSIADRVCANCVSAGSSKKRNAQGISSKMSNRKLGSISDIDPKTVYILLTLVLIRSFIYKLSPWKKKLNGGQRKIFNL